MAYKIADKTWSKWKLRRKKTIIGFILVGTVVGIDYSVIFSTLYLYLKETIKSENPEVYYGLIIGSYAMSSSLMGVIAGRWIDKTRRIKLYTNITLFLQLFGALLYVIPFHVAFPLIGRFIAGAGDPFTNICTGEIVRIYSETRGTRALWWLAACYSVGQIVGPVLPLVFNMIQFEIGPIHINKFNFVGIFMASLLIIAIIAVNFLVHDCSKEIDLKEYMKEYPSNLSVNKEESCESCNGDHINGLTTQPSVTTSNGELSKNEEALQSCDEAFVKTNIPSIARTLKILTGNSDVALMLTSTFICMYSMFAIDVLMPLIILVILQWPLNALILFFIACGAGYLIMLVVLSRICNSNISLYNMMLVCITCEIFMFLVIIALKYRSKTFMTDVILVTMLGVFWLFTCCIEEVLIRAILSKKVPSDVQSFAESFRNGISSVSTVLAALTSPLILPFIEWWALAMMVIVSLLLLAFLIRRRSLTDADEIDFHRLSASLS